MAHLQAESKRFSFLTELTAPQGRLSVLMTLASSKKNEVEAMMSVMTWPGKSHSFFTMCYHSHVLFMGRESAEKYIGGFAMGTS